MEALAGGLELAFRFLHHKPELHRHPGCVRLGGILRNSQTELQTIHLRQKAEELSVLRRLTELQSLFLELRDHLESSSPSEDGGEPLSAPVKGDSSSCSERSPLAELVMELERIPSSGSDSPSAALPRDKSRLLETVDTWLTAKASSVRSGHGSAGDGILGTLETFRDLLHAQRTAELQLKALRLHYRTKVIPKFRLHAWGEIRSVVLNSVFPHSGQQQQEQTPLREPEQAILQAYTVFLFRLHVLPAPPVHGKHLPRIWDDPSLQQLARAGQLDLPWEVLSQEPLLWGVRDRAAVEGILQRLRRLQLDFQHHSASQRPGHPRGQRRLQQKHQKDLIAASGLLSRNLTAGLRLLLGSKSLGFPWKRHFLLPRIQELVQNIRNYVPRILEDPWKDDVAAKYGRDLRFRGRWTRIAAEEDDYDRMDCIVDTWTEYARLWARKLQAGKLQPPPLGFWLRFFRAAEENRTEVPDLPVSPSFIFSSPSPSFLLSLVIFVSFSFWCFFSNFP